MSNGSHSGRRHTPMVKVRRNGNGAGHHVPPRHHEEQMPEQPRIEEILGGNDGNQLDKATLLTALRAFKEGDFTARLPIDLDGIDGKIADAFNEVIATKSDVRVDKDVYNALGAANVVKRYQSAGAAGGKPFEEQLAAWKKRLGM